MLTRDNRRKSFGDRILRDGGITVTEQNDRDIMTESRNLLALTGEERQELRRWRSPELLPAGLCFAPDSS